MERNDPFVQKQYKVAYAVLLNILLNNACLCVTLKRRKRHQLEQG